MSSKTNNKIRVLILGGSGFIGYHIVHACIKKNYAVSSVDLKPATTLPENVASHVLNADSCSDNTLVDILKNYDVVIDTLGADDRVVPNKPAYPFFRRANVEHSQRLIRLAKLAGVKNVIMLSSYYCHFSKELPELKLSEKHPYIKSRLKQMDVAIVEAGEDIGLNILQLPFVFGATPGIKPLWYESICALKYLSYFPMIYTDGGTNVVSVRTVAAAAAAAVEHSQGRHSFLIGEKNLHWPALMQSITAFFGRSPKLIKVASDSFSYLSHLFQYADYLRGKEAGLNKSYVNELLTQELFFDPEIAAQALDYELDDVDKAIQETAQVCEKLLAQKMFLKSNKWFSADRWKRSFFLNRMVKH